MQIEHQLKIPCEKITFNLKFIGGYLPFLDQCGPEPTSLMAKLSRAEEFLRAKYCSGRAKDSLLAREKKKSCEKK